ncbi:tetratricopeptide repeat protein [Pseudomarimonas arenosa]|uniref:Tetratricopeptide repeat protein n=1 Tax=Pseudomarimonas arenosa TaxID=2774145 RepID=A0AAW3ZPM6_9GAMM|nr:tetratricopeptide repeat protein [Pseudomarimonas arenosa]MBD8527908.1 tetratricopeptide repeat protein [Pseudomarimonas arenosa]
MKPRTSRSAPVSAPPKPFSHGRSLPLLLVLLGLLAGLLAMWWQLRDAERRIAELETLSEFHERAFEHIDLDLAGRRLSKDMLASYEDVLAKQDLDTELQARHMEAFETALRQVQPAARARQLIVSTLFKPALKGIEKDFSEQPAIEASLRQTLADRYYFLDLYDESLAQQQQALSIRQRVLGEDHPDTLNSLANLASLLAAQGKLEEAEALHRKALEQSRQLLGEESPDTLTSINNLAVLLQDLGKLDEAEALYREGLEKSQRVLGRDDPDTLISLNNLAVLLHDRGEFEEAEAIYRDLLAKNRRVLGEEHPDTLIVQNTLAGMLQDRGDYAAAEPLFRSAVERSQRVLGDDHPDTLIATHNLAALLAEEGKLDEAEDLYREVVKRSDRVLGDGHRETLVSMNNLAVLLHDHGKLAEAETLYRRLLAQNRRTLGDEHPGTVVAMANLGFLLLDRGKLEEADQWIRAGWRGRIRLFGEQSEHTMISELALARLLNDQGKPQQALDLLLPIEARLRAAFTGAMAYRLGQGLTQIGRAHMALGQIELAEQRLLEGQSVLEDAPGSDPRDRRRSLEALLDFYQQHAERAARTPDRSELERWRSALEQVP